MINIGDKEVSSIKLGSTNVISVYQGSELIWLKIRGYIVDANASLPADYCLYDSQEDKIIIVHPDNSGDIFKADRYEPIGVVVVPGTHNVYGDGSCGVMSLKLMSCDTPDIGSISDTAICYGNNVDVPSLPNLNQVPYVGIGSAGDNSSTIIGQSTDIGYIPSDRFSRYKCPHDTDTGYYHIIDSTICIPSPYLTDESRNPAYYQTSSPSSSSNALADFDGIGNSQILWDLATAQNDWKTASTITDDSSEGYYPAACCCWRYHTNGTKQGDWYLPACGELGYISPPFNKINTAITNLLTAYGSSFGITIPDQDNSRYMSSTERNSTTTICINLLNCAVSWNYKFSRDRVRAFLRVPSQL